MNQDEQPRQTASGSPEPDNGAGPRRPAAQPRPPSQEPAPFTNPIVSGPDPVSLFGRREQAPKGFATVLHTAKGALVTESQINAMGRVELLQARVRATYRVDVRWHHLRFATSPVCRGGEFAFHFDVRVVWRVEDPARIVEHNVEDVVTPLRDVLESEIRAISRRFDVSERERALLEVNDELGGVQELDIGIAFRRFEASFSDHESVRAATEIIAEQTLDRLRRGRELEAETHALHKRELHDDYEDRLRQKRIDAIVRQLAGLDGAMGPGHVRLLAFMVADHPEDISGIVAQVHKMEQVSLAQTVEALQGFLASGQVTGYETKRIRDAVIHLLDGLRPTLFVGREEPAGPPPLPASKQPVLEGTSRPSQAHKFDEPDDDEVGS